MGPPCCPVAMRCPRPSWRRGSRSVRPRACRGDGAQRCRRSSRPQVDLDARGALSPSAQRDDPSLDDRGRSDGDRCRAASSCRPERPGRRWHSGPASGAGPVVRCHGERPRRLRSPGVEDLSHSEIAVLNHRKLRQRHDRLLASTPASQGHWGQRGNGPSATHVPKPVSPRC